MILVNRLPNEILQEIFGYCVDDILAVDQTCSAFHEAGQYSWLWRQFSSSLYSELGLLKTEIPVLSAPRIFYYNQNRVNHQVKETIDRIASKQCDWDAGLAEIAKYGIQALHGLTKLRDRSTNGSFLRKGYIAHELLKFVRRKRIFEVLAEFAKNPDQYDVVDLFPAVECTFSSNLPSINAMVDLLASSYRNATNLDPRKLSSDLANHVVLIMSLPTMTGTMTERMQYRSLAHLYTVTMALRAIGYAAKPWIQDCGLLWTGIVEITTKESEPFYLLLKDQPETMAESQFNEWVQARRIKWAGLKDASCAMITYLYSASGSTADTARVAAAANAIFETRGTFIEFKSDSFQLKQPGNVHESESTTVCAKEAIDSLFPRNPIMRVPISPLAGCVIEDSGRLGVVISEQEKTVKILGENGSVSMLTKSFCYVVTPRLGEIKAKFGHNWVLLGQYFRLYDSAEFL
ncbi:hypothetical protein TRVA0_049S00518 [Trichomonascus vanleenenianus]|uniref:F-box protein n=1 Tax=Trichomonascus vanleenenianus TaxID=2268995 RepID=UPI003ECA23F0